MQERIRRSERTAKILCERDIQSLVDAQNIRGVDHIRMYPRIKVSHCILIIDIVAIVPGFHPRIVITTDKSHDEATLAETGCRY